MPQYSYSRVSLFENCPYHFKLRYIDKLTELIDYNNAAHPLIIGNALHKGIETNVETAINEYFNAFPGINNRMIEESMKLEILIPKVKEFLEEFKGFEFIHEYKIDKPKFVGYVDLILVSPNKECMVLDFKYSNHIKNYMDSGQLHIYKHYLEQDGFNVKQLGYLFVPKTSIKQKENEDLFHFRKRLVKTVENSEVTYVPIDYDDMNVVYFYNNIKKIEAAKDYPKNVSGDCFSCNPKFRPNYLEAIQNDKGEIDLILPKNERRERTIDTKPDFWIYADSYVGKSTFVDQIDNVLFLNTDGNTDNTTAPVIPIKDVVKKEGRRTNRTLAWDVFLDVIQDLETEQNEFEAVALDLVEDLYEHCRVYVFEKNGWEHESDGSFGKGWSKVTTEFNNAMKRLKALGYQVIYISKELVEEINLKGGAKRTTFKPNIKDKIANFLTGTVDLTLRAFVDSNDERFLQLSKKQNVFGGGRFAFQVDTIPLEMDTFIEELTVAQEGKVTKKKEKVEPTAEEEKPKRERKKKESEPEEDTPETATENTDVDSEPTEEKQRRQRKKRKEVEEEPDQAEVAEEAAEEEEKEEKPKRRRKKREPVEEETPPGEEAPTSEDKPAEEKPKKRTRKRRTRVNN